MQKEYLEKTDEFFIADKKRLDRWEEILDDTVDAVIQLRLQGKKRILFIEKAYMACEANGDACLKKHSFIKIIADRAGKKAERKKH